MNFLSAGVNYLIGDAYVLTKCRKEWNNARAAANNIFTSVASGQINVAITQVRQRVDTAYSKLQNAESYVESLENGLNIQERWSTTSPEYQSFYQQIVQTNYEQALDELEHLVVMRLFELAKMSTSGTGIAHLPAPRDPLNFKIGYKLRRQIGKALQRRSEAIKNALNRYNVQAAKLTPPRPSLSWKEIVDYSFLGEFDLL
jgi:exonuclease VII small subunit